MTITGATPAIRLHEYAGDGEPRAVLYCLPHAGGTAPFYRPWAPLLPPGIGLCALQLPGRQEMMRSPSFTDMDSLADAVAAAVAEDTRGRRYMFFGHSMGALLAFEVARRLRRAGAPGCELLGISACPAPHLDGSQRDLHALPDERLLAHVAELGGLAPEVLGSPELLELALPVIRADFALLAGYKYREEEPLDCAFRVFGGLSDHTIPEESLREWQQYSRQPMRVDRYPGGHFYLERWRPHIIEALCDWT